MTVTTIQTVADKSAKTLTTVQATLFKIVGELNTLTGSVPAMVEAAQEAQATAELQAMAAKEKLDGIEAETTLKVRDANVELAMQVRENEDKVLATLLAKRNYSALPTTELATLEARLNNDEDSAKSDINKAVAIAVANAKRDSEAAAREATSNHQVEVAQKDAAIVAKDMQIAFQAQTIQSLESTVNAEREARVLEAQARSGSQVTVNTSAK